MGISGLLPLLKSIQKPCNLKKFSGQTIGVDAYGWLHRGTASCAIELALDKPTTKYVDFAMTRVRMLVHFGITPYIVFDGDYLPSKAGTEQERAEKRKESRRLGLELLKVGKTSQAHLELQKAVDVTPEMARHLIEELKYHNIQYVVAPYEADSQLAYLERKGVINGILSEDSDLLVFGAKCLITKLDKYGECVEINRNLFTACREVSLVGWSDADFRRMAMLSGCDYLPGIGKMGLKTAHRMLRKHKTVDRLVKAAQFDGQFKVPPGFMDAFFQAEMTFLYQWVFCPLSNQLVNLTPPEPGVDITAMPYIGKHVPSDIAIGVANGNLHPHTKKPIVIKPLDRSRTKPLRPAQRAAPPAQTPDLKHTKPIESFFKPKRTPLAELDPNIFTPSPSQQALLEEQQQHSGPWTAELAPTSTFASRPQQRPSSSRTAPLPPRRTVSESVTRASAPHHSKRQRLCSDVYVDTSSSTRVENERSRFFASSVPEPSPSLRTANKNKKKGSRDFDVYSSDSFDEALIELADLEEATSLPKKKLSIFRDDSRTGINNDSQSTTISKDSTENSQDSTRPLTPATSFGSLPPDESEETVFSAALSSNVKALRAKYTYNASVTVQHTPSESLPLKAAFKSNMAQTGPRRASRGLGQADVVSKGIAEENTPKPGHTQQVTVELEDSAWAAMEAEVVVPASDTEGVEMSAEASTSRTFEVQGSEDLLIPESEAESDCSPRRPMLDLGRFAFYG